MSYSLCVLLASSTLARVLGDCSTIHCLPALFFFFIVEISSRAQIPLFTPGSVHCGSASRDDFGGVVPGELRVSSFPDRFSHYACVTFTHRPFFRNRVSSSHFPSILFSCLRSVLFLTKISLFFSQTGKAESRRHALPATETSALLFSPFRVHLTSFFTGPFQAKMTCAKKSEHFFLLLISSSQLPVGFFLIFTTEN